MFEVNINSHNFTNYIQKLKWKQEEIPVFHLFLRYTTHTQIDFWLCTQIQDLYFDVGDIWFIVHPAVTQYIFVY